MEGTRSESTGDDNLCFLANALQRRAIGEYLAKWRVWDGVDGRGGGVWREEWR